MTYLLILLLGAAVGYFLAVVVLSSSIRDDIARLDQERQEIDDEREALHLAWLSAAPPPGPKVSFAIGAHRRMKLES